MSEVTLQFLDVGMGDGTLAQLRHSGQGYDTLMLVDFGENRSQFKVGWKDALGYLTDTIGDNSKTRNAPTPYLDYLFITHPDIDHYNKIEDLVNAKFRNYPAGTSLKFGEVYYGGTKNEYAGGKLINNVIGPNANKVSELPDNYHAPIAGGKVQPNFNFGGINVYILAANYPKRVGGKSNPKSIVLMIELDKHKVILQGDAEKPTEDEILNHYSGVAGFLDDVYGLKLGHHGSRNGTSPNWVTKLKPKSIFASGDFVWTHPYCEAICRVVNNGTLTKRNTDYWYCCGSGQEYFNNKTRDAICMNLFYWVKSQNGENLIHENVDTGKKTPFFGQAASTYGVQWALGFDGVDDPEFMVTDMTYPANPGAIPGGWDCAKNGPALRRAFVPAEAVRRRRVPGGAIAAPAAAAIARGS